MIVASFDTSNVTANLKETSSPFVGNIHPTFFPLNYLEKSNVYFQDSLFSYKAFDATTMPSLDSFPYFLHLEDGISLLLKCSNNCMECTSFVNCISCSPGFYVSNGLCLPCSSKCSSCVDHPEKCTACTDDPNTSLAGNISFLLNLMKSPRSW
jgi:hypothetical protein